MNVNYQRLALAFDYFANWLTNFRTPRRALLDGLEFPEGRLRVIVPTIRHWMHLPFLVGWLSLWGFAVGLLLRDIAVLTWRVLMSDPVQALQKLHGLTLPGMFAFFPFLLLFGSPILYLTLWMFLGSEVITLYREELCYERRIGKWRFMQWRVNHKRIEKFCPTWERDSKELSHMLWSLQNPENRCEVSVVRKAGKDRRFGIGLNPIDREWIVDALNERLARFSATTSANVAPPRVGDKQSTGLY